MRRLLFTPLLFTRLRARAASVRGPGAAARGLVLGLGAGLLLGVAVGVGFAGEAGAQQRGQDIEKRRAVSERAESEAMRARMRAHRKSLTPEQRQLLERRHRNPASLSDDERRQLREIRESFRSSLDAPGREHLDAMQQRGHRPSRGVEAWPDVGGSGTRDRRSPSGRAAQRERMERFRDSLGDDERALHDRLRSGDTSLTHEERLRLRNSMREFQRSLPESERDDMRRRMRRAAEVRRSLRELPEAERRALRERWHDLPQEERRRIRGELEALGPGGRGEVEGHLREFRQLPDAERDELRERYRALRGYSPAERDQLEANTERWRAMPDESKARLRRQMERLRAMSPEERLELLDRLLETPTQEPEPR